MMDVVPDMAGRTTNAINCGVPSGTACPLGTWHAMVIPTTPTPRLVHTAWFKMLKQQKKKNIPKITHLGLVGRYLPCHVAHRYITAVLVGFGCCNCQADSDDDEKDGDLWWGGGELKGRSRVCPAIRAPTQSLHCLLSYRMRGDSSRFTTNVKAETTTMTLGPSMPIATKASMDPSVYKANPVFQVPVVVSLFTCCTRAYQKRASIILTRANVIQFTFFPALQKGFMRRLALGTLL